MMKSLF